MENTTHPASKANIEINGNEGRPCVFCATKGRRLKIEKDGDTYNVSSYNILTPNKKPVCIVGLSLEQADAIGWLFCSLDI